MKCLIPVLAMIIFIIQIHAIFVNNSNSYENKILDPCVSLETLALEKNSFNDYTENPSFLETLSISFISEEKKKKSYTKENKENASSHYFKNVVDYNTSEKTDDDCSEIIINCICKCGLAFLAGILISDMKFIKFGVL